jgi:probable HAF family extracellular repeat protein
MNSIRKGLSKSAKSLLKRALLVQVRNLVRVGLITRPLVSDCLTAEGAMPFTKKHSNPAEDNMRLRMVLGLLSGVLLLCNLNAQRAADDQPQYRYRVIDLGTLGGTYAEPGGINNHTEIEGFSTLPGDDVERGFFWSHGQFTAIPGLGGPNSTAGWAISESGQMGAAGDTGQPDPLGEDFCGFGEFTICLPYVWQRGTVTLLPLPGGSNGVATGFNNRDQVTGKVEKDAIDANCKNAAHQTQGIVWKEGKIDRLLAGFPGDTQGAGHSINDLGQAVGWSGNCSGPPFFNHALLWDHGRTIDLGTLGGKSGQAYNINNHSEIVGFSRVAAGPRHGFLWRKGSMIDVGVLPGDLSSEAAAVNNLGEIVGFSTDALGNERAFHWYRGAMMDLNTLAKGDSPLYLLEGDYINDRGQIVGIGLEAASGEIHGYLATPIAAEYEDESGPSRQATVDRPFVSNSALDRLIKHLVHRHMSANGEKTP